RRHDGRDERRHRRRFHRQRQGGNRRHGTNGMDGKARQAMRWWFGDPKRVAPLLFLLFVAAPIAQTSIKLATLVPQNSVWDKKLKQMGEEWKQATGGRFDVTVYAGGTQGDEPTVLRKMRL